MHFYSHFILSTPSKGKAMYLNNRFIDLWSESIIGMDSSKANKDCVQHTNLTSKKCWSVWNNHVAMFFILNKSKSNLRYWNDSRSSVSNPCTFLFVSSACTCNGTFQSIVQHEQKYTANHQQVEMHQHYSNDIEHESQWSIWLNGESHDINGKLKIKI